MSPNGRFSPIKAPIKNIHTNLDQEVIQITEDKLRLVLNNHIQHIEKVNSWIAPFGILISASTTFITSEFKDVFFLKAPTLEALYILIILISFIWLLHAIYQAYKSPSVTDIVEKIKNRSV